MLQTIVFTWVLGPAQDVVLGKKHADLQTGIHLEGSLEILFFILRSLHSKHDNH